MATNAAWREFRRVYTNPNNAQRDLSNAERAGHYALLWSYYQNSAFDDLVAWAAYRSRHRLYRYARSIYNPARRLVDFYAGIVYQGAWPQDPVGMTQPSAAVPFAVNTPPDLLNAIGQVWQWSNWPAKSTLLVRYGAALGDCLVVVVDDVPRAKVYTEVIYPGHVTDLALNPAGDVIAYTLEFEVSDADASTYTYRREVDKTSIRTFRNGQPHAYDGQPAEIDNPYGFVPACWLLHTPVGSQHGEPALRTINKIDELNSLASHALDLAHRTMEAPILISGENIQRRDLESDKAPQSGSTGRVNAETAQESFKLITSAAGARMETIRMEPGEALEHMDRMLREIEADHPELTMFSRLREMSSITGPAADRLFGDVAALVNSARTQYDRQLIKLCQMAVAVAGWRVNTGAWGAPNAQQQLFLPFDLESYDAGALTLSIQARGLVPPTEIEMLELAQRRATIAADTALRTAHADNAPSAIAARLRTMAMEPAS